MLRHQERTGRVPPALERRPELPDHLTTLWQDYIRLSRSRRYEQGQPLPIPLDILDRYCQRFGPYTTDEFERFITLIEVMDAAYLERARQ